MKIAILLAGMMLPLASPVAAPETPRAEPPSRPDSDPFRTPNLYRQPADCESIPWQVAGEDRRYGATRLDQQPPGKTLLAVHRVIDGCPVATLASEERARRR
jgi:hypothetical protein